MIETIFTPYQSLIGGALIGVSTVMLMWLHGRILGATGILAGFILPASLSDWLWRAVILAGMIAAPAIYFLGFGEMPTFQVPVSQTMLIVGGLIVGVGVTLGSGCTSGHGVCGMARLSFRSIAATGIFMFTTAVTVYVIRHVIG